MCRKPLSLFLLFLLIPFLHDLLIKAEFLSLCPMAIEQIERNLDQERRGGYQLDSRLRYIDCDDKKTPEIQEYELLFRIPFILSPNHPKIRLSYSRK